jgi:transposase
LITLRSDLKIMVASRPVDFRRGINGLVALVAEALFADPYCGDIFVFRSKRQDRLKLIAWDGSGMVLVTKWLEQGRFTWPPIRDGAVRLSAAQMAMLIDGLDWTRVSPPVIKRPTMVG